jgi:hypothetical protein
MNAPSSSSLRRFLLQRAFWILGGFTVLAFCSIPSVTSRLTQSPPYLLLARILLAIGTLIWVSTFVACIRTSFLDEERPSFIAALTFFLFLGFELFVLADAGQIP